MIVRSYLRNANSAFLTWAIARSGLTAAALALFLSGPALVHAEAVPITPEVAITAAAKRASAGLGGFGNGAQWSWLPGTHRIIYAQVPAGAASASIFELDADSGRSSRICAGRSPVPSPDGRWIAFLGPNDVEGATPATEQIWIARPDGADARELTRNKEGMTGNDRGPSMRAASFKWSPDSQRLLCWVFSGYVPTGQQPVAGDAIKHATKSSAEVAPSTTPGTGLVDEYSLLLIGVATGESRLMAQQEEGRVGQLFTYGWLGNDRIFYEHDNDKLHDLEQLRSSVTVKEIGTGKTETVIEGYARQAIYAPVADPSGERLAFLADPGEAVYYPWRRELAICTVATHKISVLTQYAAVSGPLAWTPDGNHVVYVDGPSCEREIYVSDLKGERHRVTSGPGKNADVSFTSDGQWMVWTHQDPSQAKTLRIGRWDGSSVHDERELLALDEPLQGFQVGSTREVTWKNSAGESDNGWLVTPPSSVASGPFPLVVILHGGPMGGANNAFSEWPGEVVFPQLLVNLGYAVFIPDFTNSGLSGFDRILRAREHGAYITADADDILCGVDRLVKDGVVDNRRLFLLGHSYGSLLANWVTTHSNRFRAIVSYEGFDVFLDYSSVYQTNPATEWYLNGTPADRPEAYLNNSAALHTAGASTPTLFVTAGKAKGPTNSMAWMYSALRRRNVEAEYVHYPDDLHVLQKVENQRDLLARILDWIKRHDQQ